MHPSPSVPRQAAIRRPRASLVAYALLIALTATVSAAMRPSVIRVADVEALYAAVNDPGNAGAKIVLAPGRYALTARDATGSWRPNGGRLELQPGMSLTGAPGRPADVQIDASGPQGPTLTGPQGGPGVIRMGRTGEAIEWLTVRGAAGADAGIVTDLVGDRTVSLRIAHTIVEGCKRGIDVRNVGPSGAGRTILIELIDNDLRGNTAGAGQGLRFANTNGANGAAIFATLRGNRSHDNLTGCLVANLASNGASIDIESHNDRFDTNVVGCILLGGITTSPTATANDNTITFNAQAGEIAHNVGVLLPDGDTGGLVAVGGLSAVPGAASRNLVQVLIGGKRFAGNQDTDISAWGARTTASAPAGTGNFVLIKLDGVSKQAITDAVQSMPEDPAGTNWAIIEQ